ncbi:HNH endonuclease [Cellulomonas bogoriensis]|uniref:HNH nuclease domain-containing protein n=1 Tax=Cellulomonas bogoriensis 69B4 = DSM 16987 TaxID=1386082 RepID=A0A0A0C1B4_9CELL|nr:HNH endonuclease [Cellulomonas bogoriensis]KGM14438.1 hypothetical protein N869_11140 [Cellulomonas bogoriensis 69B4 = DSM 16987]
MVESLSRAVWSCHSHVASPEDLLYGDRLGHRYEYDSHVINHAQVSVGDLLVIRDAHLVYGYGVVESIDRRPGIKTMRRCPTPTCRSADIVARKRLSPTYRCNDCKNTFAVPVPEEKDVLLYSATYQNWWFEFPSTVPVRVLSDLYAGGDRQNAIRRLVPDQATRLLGTLGGVEAFLHLELLGGKTAAPGGHVERLVRQRVGQQQFRERLIDRYGATCAVTGTQPEAVLDAAHLLPFADRPVHDEDGGLLLRADLHRMFDRLLLTIDPATWTSRVAPAVLRKHERLSAFDRQPVAVADRVRPRRSLIEAHHLAARRRWRDLEPTVR